MISKTSFPQKVEDLSFAQKVESIKKKYVQEEQKESLNISEMVKLFEENEN